MIRIFNAVAFALVITGALNWGLIGVFKFNLVEALFGIESLLSNTIYVLVGLSGLYLIATSAKIFFVGEHLITQDNMRNTINAKSTKTTTQI